jgi:hypothetical protein
MAIQDAMTDSTKNIDNLRPEAKRALAEAEARRNKMESQPKMAVEINGRTGPEPVRYGDWEKNGIACDF